VSFAEALSTELLRHGLTQSQAARDLGISQQAMNQLCCGSRVPSHRLLLLLLKKFPRLSLWVLGEAFF
jgi:transcriptional regulator with XRE-family HTH domain